MSRLIAITGGIGSGKSVVCKILTCLGYRVYDCDSRARTIMDSDPLIKQALKTNISESAVNADGSIDRQHIASIVFNDPDKLTMLNSIVHGAVRQDLERWYKQGDKALAFVETAILYESHLDTMVDEVWDVEAPIQTRICRVCRRNNLSREQVMARINSQSYTPAQPHPHTYTIINDGVHPLLPQIHALIDHNDR